MFTDFIIVLKSKYTAPSVVDFVFRGSTDVMLAVAQFCTGPLEDQSDRSHQSLLNRMQDVESMCEYLAVDSVYEENKGRVMPTDIFWAESPRYHYVDMFVDTFLC